MNIPIELIKPGDATKATLTISFKVPRRLRRAMTSRRWEKKFCKGLSEALGYRVLSITKRRLPKGSK